MINLCNYLQFFSSVYLIGTTLFNKCFLFHVITERQFLIKVYRYPEILFNRHVLAFFERSDLEEVRILSFISRITAQC